MPSLLEEVVCAQGWDHFAYQLVDNLIADEIDGCPYKWSMRSDGGVRLFGHVYALGTGNLRWRVMDEAHRSRLSIHHDGNKMYHDMSRIYWWSRMKMTIGNFVAKYATCQRVKVEYQRPSSLCQSLQVPD